jgi:hypothetical protein
MAAAARDLASRRVVAAQWAGVLGPPIIWALRFGLNYAMMPLACAADAALLLHAANAIAVLALLALTFVALRFRRVPDEAAAVDTELHRRTRFMGLFGLMSAALFLVVIIAESLAVLMIDPCLVAGPLVPH